MACCLQKLIENVSVLISVFFPKGKIIYFNLAPSVGRVLLNKYQFGNLDIYLQFPQSFHKNEKESGRQTKCLSRPSVFYTDVPFSSDPEKRLQNWKAYLKHQTRKRVFKILVFLDVWTMYSIF